MLDPSARQSFGELVADSFGIEAVPRFSNYQAKAVYDLAPSRKLSSHTVSMIRIL